MHLDFIAPKFTISDNIAVSIIINSSMSFVPAVGAIVKLRGRRVTEVVKELLHSITPFLGPDGKTEEGGTLL